MQRLTSTSTARTCLSRCLPAALATTTTLYFPRRFFTQGAAEHPSSSFSSSGRSFQKSGDGFARGGSRQDRHAKSTSGSPPSSTGRDRGRTRGGPIKDRYPPMLVNRSDPRRRLAVLVDGTNSALLRTGGVGADVASAIRQSSPLYAAVLPAILKVGVPVLLRLFAHELPGEWGPLLAGTPAFAGAGASGGHEGAGSTRASTTLLPLTSSSSATAGAAEIQFEFFRVERFIPIPMQMEADAQHIFDFRNQNLIEGVCYVAHEVDRGMYESIMEEQLKGAFLSTNAAAAAVQATAWLSSASSRAKPTTRSGGDAATSSSGAGDEAGAAKAAFFNQYLLDELGIVKEINIDGRPGDGA